MPKDFLTNRLVTAKGFGPGEKGGLASNKAGGLDDILEKEDQQTRVVVAKRDVVETGRRRSEVERDLNEIVGSLEAEQQIVREKLARFSELQKTVSGLPENVEEKHLTEVKQAVRAAHAEMLIHHREGLHQEESSSGLDWASLTFGQLTRVGLALSWPLILGLIIAAVIVAGSLSIVFGVE